MPSRAFSHSLKGRTEPRKLLTTKNGCKVGGARWKANKPDWCIVGCLDRRSPCSRNLVFTMSVWDARKRGYLHECFTGLEEEIKEGLFGRKILPLFVEEHFQVGVCCEHASFCFSLCWTGRSATWDFWRQFWVSGEWFDSRSSLVVQKGDGVDN